MIIGIDYGSSRLKAVVFDDNLRIKNAGSCYHHGDLFKALQRLFCELRISDNSAVIGWTGLKPGTVIQCDLFKYTETARAVLEGTLFAVPSAGSVLDAGAQQCLLLDGLQDGRQLFVDCTSGCSAGTGSFFEEQIDRLGYTIEQLPSLLTPVERIPIIAGRCTVFARTDIVHRQQEGYSISEILHGLAYSTARSLSGALLKGRELVPPLLLAGGMSGNPVFAAAIGKVTNLGEEVFISEYSNYLGAIGAAVEAVKPSRFEPVPPVALRLLTVGSADAKAMYRGGEFLIRNTEHLRPLFEYGTDDSSGKHEVYGTVDDTGKFYLGIDIGSTSTNLVLIDEKSRIVDYVYEPTRGEPEVVINNAIEKLRVKYGFDKIPASVTGSGRRRTAARLGIESTLDEITAQARGAKLVYGENATIFEIGGQDSKYINNRNGLVQDFRMNRICAAGTGAFLEEQAKQLGVSLKTFVKLALDSKDPVFLDENCTVFMRNSVVSALKNGIDRADIAAGLCYAVVRNYLKRVAAAGEWGDIILLQGGIAYNQAVVNAFRVITGKKIIVPDFFSVTGALGAALCIMEDSCGPSVPAVRERKKDTVSYNELLTKEYKRPLKQSSNGKRIGIPRVLFIYKMFPLFNAFFRGLGYEVVLSNETDEKIVEKAQAAEAGEPCYPVKLIFGHAESLLEMGIDILFLPSLITMRHEGSTVRRNYACIMMQTAPHYIEKALNLEQKGVQLLTSRLNMDVGKKGLTNALFDIGHQLGASKPRIMASIGQGAAAFIRFQRKLNSNGSRWLDSLKQDEPAFVIVSRPYGLHDTELNKGIPEILEELQAPVLSLTELPIESYALDDHSNMYWPFGQHILKGIDVILENKNLHLIFITNHGCGPDTILLHYVDAKMNGRPYLHIEVDEHASSEGIRTRLEAFVRSVKGAAPECNHLCGLERSELPLVGGLSTENLLPYPYEGANEIFIPPYIPAVTRNRGIIGITAVKNNNNDSSMVRTKEDPALRALWVNLSNWLAEDESRRDVFLPVNEGAGTDGQYARLIRLWLDLSGRKDVRIYSPYLEDMAGMPKDSFELLAEALVRSDLVRRISDLGGIETEGSVEEFAEVVRRLEDVEKSAGKGSILVTGDPWIVFDENWISDDVIRPLQKAGYIPVRMPVSEMMLFFWSEKAGFGGLGGGSDSDKNILHLKKLIKTVDSFSGGFAGYSSSVEELRSSADRVLPEVSGRHLRYLAAKGFNDHEKYLGMINVAGMYDNGAEVLMQIGRDLWTPFPYKGPGEPAGPKIIEHLVLELENRDRIYSATLELSGV